MPKIKERLVGTLEIALFMKSGINNFDNDFRAMIQSFSIFVLSFVFSIMSFPFLYEAKQELQNLGFSSALVIFILKFLIGYILALGFIYFINKIMKREHNFIKFITTSNWASLINLVLFLPLFFLMKSGVSNYNDLYPHMVILSVYSYVLSAFIIRYVIDIPWELAVFITVCLLALNEAGFKMLYAFVGA